MNIDLNRLTELPRPDQIIGNLYKGGKARSRRFRDTFNDELFAYKTSKRSAFTRSQRLNQIVDLHTEHGRHFYVLRSDLDLVWGLSRRLPRDLPTNSEGYIDLQIPDSADAASDPAAEFLLKSSIIGPSTDLVRQPIAVIKKVLLMIESVDARRDIRQILLRTIARRIQDVYGICRRSRWRPERKWDHDEIMTWVDWVVFAIERYPALLWVIELVAIRTLRYSLAWGGTDCVFKRGEYYTPFKEEIEAPENRPLYRGRGLVKNICYTIETLAQLQGSQILSPEERRSVGVILTYLRDTPLTVGDTRIPVSQCGDFFEKNQVFRPREEVRSGDIPMPGLISPAPTPVIPVPIPRRRLTGAERRAEIRLARQMSSITRGSPQGS